MTHSCKNLAAALMLAGMALGAAAQPVPGAGPGAAPGAPMHMREGGPGAMMDRDAMRARMRQHMEQRMAHRLGELKQKLAVTPQQEGAWNQWISAVRPPAARIERPNGVQFARMNTPERIDTVKKLRAQRQQRLDVRLDATKAFYGTLSAPQQKVFDEESLGLLKGAAGGRRGGRHHGR